MSFSFLSGRAIYLFIFRAFFFLLTFFFLRLSSPEPTVTFKVVPVEASVGAVALAPVAFDSVSYYRPILEYNIFRPLGWTPLVPVEPYRLIGTILPRSANRPPQAVVQRTTSHQGNNRHENNNPITLDKSTKIS